MSKPGKEFLMTRNHGRRTEMNRSKTRSRACFRVIRANGKVEQHILIFDPAELHSLKVNAFIELHPGDRLDDYFDLRDLTART
jgi:hypothetical protein